MTRKTFAYTKTLGVFFITILLIFIYSTEILEMINNFDTIRSIITYLGFMVSGVALFFKLMFISDMGTYDGADEEVNFNLNFYSKFMEHQKKKQTSKEAINQLKINKQKLLLELSESNDDLRSEILIDKIKLIDENL